MSRRRGPLPNSDPAPPDPDRDPGFSGGNLVASCRACGFIASGPAFTHEFTLAHPCENCDADEMVEGIVPRPTA